MCEIVRVLCSKYITAESLEVQMMDLDIVNAENEEFIFDEGSKEEVNRFELCLVGRFLTMSEL